MTLETERAFICSLRTLDDLAAASRMGIGDEHFSSLLPVWQFISRYAASYGDVPPAELLRERYELEPSTAGAVGYEAERLHRDYLVQAARGLMMEASQALDGGNPANAINDTIAGLTNLRLHGRRNVGYLDADVRERGDEVRRRFEERSAAGGDYFIGVPTGVEPVDVRGVGWWPGGVYALVGMTSAGKSALMSRFAAEAWMRRHRVLIVSPEMSRSDLGYRLDAVLMHQLGIKDGPTNWGVMTGDVTPQQLEAYRAYEERLSARSDILIVDTRGEHAGITVEDVRMLGRQHRAELVLIDGFKYLDDMRKGKDQWNQHLNLFKDLMRITRQEGWSTVLAEHTKTDYKPFDAPLANQTYMGGHLGNEADVLITVWLSRGHTDRRYLAMPKSRLGPTFSVGKEISFDVDTGDIGRWVDSAATKRGSDLARFLPSNTVREEAADRGFAG